MRAGRQASTRRRRRTRRRIPVVRGAEVTAAVPPLIGNDDSREATGRLQREAQKPPIEPRPAVHADDSRTSPVTDPLIPPTR